MSREPIAAPFRSRAALVGFLALVLGLLALPLALHAAHAPSARARLITAPVSAGPYAHLEREIFEEPGDIDLLFVGDSVVWVGIDTPAVARRLSADLHRPAIVRTLGWPWAGHDLLYQVLRELLARRRVHHVVLRLWPGEMHALPHPQSYRWLDASRDPVIPTLPVTDRLAVHGIEVVGGLRNLLSLVRPDLVGPSKYAATLGHKSMESALEGQTYRPFHPTPPALPADGVVVRQPWPADLLVRDEALGPYQAGYAAAIRDLLVAHGAAVTLLRFPARTEVGAPRLEIAGFFPALFGARARILVPRPDALFGRLRADELDALYYNDNYHLNANGSAYFTAAVLPALLGERDAP